MLQKKSHLNYKIIFICKLEFYQTFQQHGFKSTTGALISIVRLMEKSLGFKIKIDEKLKRQIKSKFIFLKKIKKIKSGRRSNNFLISASKSAYSFKIENKHIDFHNSTMVQSEIACSTPKKVIEVLNPNIMENIGILN